MKDDEDDDKMRTTKSGLKMGGYTDGRMYSASVARKRMVKYEKHRE